jgi:hypothetical protein
MHRAAAVLFTIVYLVFPTRQYYWDGLSFAINIEHTPGWRELVSVHHLLYNLLGYAEYSLFHQMVRALYLLQWTNCLAGGVLVWAAWRLFRALDVPAAHAVGSMALLAAAATFWKFTTDVDSYILANLFLVACYLSIPRSTVRGALWHVAALTMHQLSALFYPVALALLWRRSGKRFWRDAALYTLIAAGGTLALYGAGWGVARPRPAPTFFAWITYHSAIPFSFDVLRNAGWLLLGTARLFVGGKLTPSAYVLGPVVAVLLIAGIWTIRGEKARPAISLPGPILIWIGSYVLFLFFWEPYNTFYRLFYLVPLVTTIAIVMSGFPVRSLALLTAALVFWNFAQFIYPNTRIENNPPLAVALRQQKDWPSGTGVIYAKFFPDLWTISYFNPQVSWIAVEQPDPPRVAEVARDFARNGGRVYLDWTYRENSGRPARRFSFELISPVAEH